MLDPWTALSLAGNIVQFVDFGTKLIVESRSLYKSTTGISSVNQELDFVLGEVHRIIAALRRPLTQVQSPSPTLNLAQEGSSQDEQLSNDFAKICHECEKLAEELQKRIEGLRVKRKFRVWSTFQQALKSAWSKEELAELKGRLAFISEVLNTRILVSIRYVVVLQTIYRDVSPKLPSRENVDLMSMTMSHRFDNLDKQTQHIITSMVTNATRIDVNVSNELREQTLALSQLVSRIEERISQGNRETQSLITQLSKENRTTSGPSQGLSATSPSFVHPLDEARCRATADEGVLASLKFLTMTTRYDEIDDAYSETFKWIFSRSKQKRWSNFVEWLQEGAGVYWINGKAGSGKSTLMKYIKDSSQTKAFLASWGGNVPLYISTFFFWRSGTPEQRSQIGLLRVLLSNILSEQPKLIREILPAQWTLRYEAAVNHSQIPFDDSWSLPTLMKAFEALAKQTTIPLRLCLFIDGLDEFEQRGYSHETIAIWLRDITKSGDIKVCVSSRPLVMFSNVFEGSSSLRLQDLTREDINHFVSDTLHKNARFESLALKERSATADLESEIVEKADGVFLWVAIVVKSLLEGLQYRDSILDLQKRLRRLPSDLEALYGYMFEQIDPVYKESAAEIFQIVRAAREHRVWIGRESEPGLPLTNIALSLATKRNLELDDLSQLSEHQIRTMSEDMEIRLRVRCAGLVECSGPGRPEDPWSTVSYLHATARDFIEDNNDIWDEICSQTMASGFDPNAAVLKACACLVGLPAQLGAYTQAGLRVSRNSLLTSAMIYACYANRATKSLDISLMSQLQSAFLPPPKPNAIPHFVQAAVYYGSYTYVEYFLDSNPNRTKDDLTHLLHWSLSPPSASYRYPCSAKMVSILLEHGADPNKQFMHQVSPWESALEYLGGRTWRKSLDSQSPFTREWIEILKHLVLSGADPKVWVRAVDIDNFEPALGIITRMFQKSWPEETAELLQLLKARGAQLTVSKRRQPLVQLKRFFNNVRYTTGDDESESSTHKQTWDLDWVLSSGVTRAPPLQVPMHNPSVQYGLRTSV
jgi:hypothetical protein